MEVDEAASHIKELVDPDANIIWGSAFNNDLGGKIRVSVVATGIEVEALTQAAPAKVFTFPARGAPPVPGKSESRPAETSAEEDDDDILDLGSSEEIEDQDEDGDDELLLGGDDVLTTPVAAPPIDPPADEDVDCLLRLRRAGLCSSACRASRGGRQRPRSTMRTAAMAAIRSTFRGSSTARTTSSRGAGAGSGRPSGRPFSLNFWKIRAF